MVFQSPGAGCSKLTTSLVNVALKFKTSILQIHRGYSNFLLNMAFISSSEVENIYIS